MSSVYIVKGLRRWWWCCRATPRHLMTQEKTEYLCRLGPTIVSSLPAVVLESVVVVGVGDDFVLYRIIVHNVCEPPHNGTGGCEYSRVQRKGYLQWIYFGNYVFQVPDTFGRWFFFKWQTGPTHTLITNSMICWINLRGFGGKFLNEMQFLWWHVN